MDYLVTNGICDFFHDEVTITVIFGIGDLDMGYFVIHIQGDKQIGAFDVLFGMFCFHDFLYLEFLFVCHFQCFTREIAALYTFHFAGVFPGRFRMCKPV